MSYDSWKTTDPRDSEPNYDGYTNDRDEVDDSERAYTLSVDVNVPNGLDLQTVCDEILSNVQSVGWSATVTERTSALSAAAAWILVHRMFVDIVGSYPSSRPDGSNLAVSKVASIICDTVDADRETFGPLHTAYADVKALWLRCWDSAVPRG